MEITFLKDYKTKKKLLAVLTDIKVILKIYDLSLSALKLYGKYSSVMEVMSVIQNNKTLLEIQYNKYSKKLEEDENKL